MSFWNRPLNAMTESFAAAGFTVSVNSEPLPEDFGALSTNPSLLFFVLHAG